MSKKPGTSPPPGGLGKEGRRLWNAVVADVDAESWQLDSRDLEILRRAACCADDLDQLERAIDRDGHVTADGRVHGAVVEARQQRQLLFRLLSSIELVNPEELKSTRPASVRARRAARARWS